MASTRKGENLLAVGPRVASRIGGAGRQAIRERLVGRSISVVIITVIKSPFGSKKEGGEAEHAAANQQNGRQGEAVIHGTPFCLPIVREFSRVCARMSPLPHLRAAPPRHR